MSTGEAMDDSPNGDLTARTTGGREALILVMLMYGLAQCGEAFAADQAADVVKAIQPMVGGKPLPMAFAVTSPMKDLDTSTDFQPRKADVSGVEAPAQRATSSQSQPLQLAPSWQRLADYRTQGRVQLLTLWQSPRNMVSLQTGKHGGPSLQWSSRVMNRGGATRGVLDRFVASSLHATGLGFKATKSATPPSAIKPP